MKQLAALYNRSPIQPTSKWLNHGFGNPMASLPGPCAKSSPAKSPSPARGPRVELCTTSCEDSMGGRAAESLGDSENEPRVENSVRPPNNKEDTKMRRGLARWRTEPGKDSPFTPKRGADTVLPHPKGWCPFVMGNLAPPLSRVSKNEGQPSGIRRETSEGKPTHFLILSSPCFLFYFKGCPPLVSRVLERGGLALTSGRAADVQLGET